MSLAAAAVKNDAVTWFGTFLLVVAGIGAFMSLGQLEDPEFTIKDALVFTPRICGICSMSQSMAAAYALADAQRLDMPPNGERVTNLMLATENLADHFTHFYLFFMPDFAREVYRAEGLGIKP